MSVLALQKGDKAILLGFTGIRLAEVEIAKANQKTLTVIKSDGSEMVFDRKTGVQINVAEGKEKYANKLVHPSDAPAVKKKKKAEKKKKAKKVVVEEIEDDEDDDDYEEM